MPIIYNLLLWHVLQYPWSLFVITYREHLAGRIIYYPLPIFSFTFATDFVSIMISIEWSKRILIFVRSSLLRSRNVRMLHPATKNWTSEMTQYVDIYMYIYIYLWCGVKRGSPDIVDLLSMSNAVMDQHDNRTPWIVIDAKKEKEKAKANILVFNERS